TTNAAARALGEGKPDDALRVLEPLSRQALPPRDRSRVEGVRAEGWFQKSEPVRAVELCRQRENWLDDRGWIEADRRRLGAGLLVSDPQVLREASERVADSEIRGWLALGALATSTGRQGIGWSNGVIRWQKAYGDHPANSVVAEMQIPDGGALDYPRQIALLLPLSGQTAAAGGAIQNGFFGAYFAAQSGLNDEQRIRVYDVNAEGAREA